MKRLGIGVIGAGMVGQLAHLASFRDLADVDVVALAEIRPQLAAAAAARFGVRHVYPTHHDLLANPDVDAVVVVTRRNATGAIALDALRAGKHVLTEKPMAHRLEDGQRIVEAASERGLVYAVGYMKRHDFGVAEALRAIATGELGALVAARAWSHGGCVGETQGRYVMTDEPRPAGLELWPESPGWFVGGERRYDAFLNVHSHIVNLARLLLGGLQVTRADLGDGSRGSMIARCATAEVSFSFDGRTQGEWQEGLEATFERGTLVLDLPPPFSDGARARIRVDGAPMRAAESDAPSPTWAFARQAAAFVRDIREGREPLASGADSLHDLSVAESAWRLTLAANASGR